jgi:hypothetical protein
MNPLLPTSTTAVLPARLIHCAAAEFQTQTHAAAAAAAAAPQQQAAANAGAVLEQGHSLQQALFHLAC